MTFNYKQLWRPPTMNRLSYDSGMLWAYLLWIYIYTYIYVYVNTINISYLSIGGHFMIISYLKEFCDGYVTFINPSYDDRNYEIKISLISSNFVRTFMDFHFCLLGAKLIFFYFLLVKGPLYHIKLLQLLQKLFLALIVHFSFFFFFS